MFRSYSSKLWLQAQLYRSGTARNTVLVEVLSTAAQLYEKITFRKACSR